MKKLLLRTLLIFIGALGILDTVWVALISNINLGVVMPGIIGLPMVVYGVFFTQLNEWMRGCLIGRILGIAALAVYAAFFIGFAISTAVLVRAGNAAPAPDADAVIVLGGGIRGERVSMTLARRLSAAKKYHDENPDSLIVVSGGQGEGENVTEAEAMKKYLLSHGVAEESIVMEDRATSTVENFRFSMSLIREITGKSDPRIVYVTTRFHVYRAGLVAASQGINAEGLGSAGVWYIALNDYMREFAALVNYRITGKI